MNILLVLAHPDKTSFNHAIAATAAKQIEKNGHNLIYHDLYEENFDPALPAEEIPKDAPLPTIVEKHCKETATADGIIIIHPNWWGMPPALLTGWIDRVLRPGTAYKFLEGDDGEGVPVGLLKAKSAIVLNTSNTGREREESIFGDPLERIWKNCIFDLCGVQKIYRRMFRIIVTSTKEERKQWLQETAAVVNKAFPPSP